jgi:hypothetical protein
LLLFLYQTYSRVRANFCEVQQNKGLGGLAGFSRPKKNRDFVTVSPGFCYVKRLR